ncbi:MAG: alpha/beta hydrolase [Clostridiales bacterium]|nr:alpha/beta hydrolase [Clostridiales bacterium]
MKPILLALALVFTVLSSFLPYSSELMLGLAAVCLFGYVVPVLLHRESGPGWFRIAVTAGVCLSVVLTLILAIGHALGLVTVIEAMNLIIIAFSGIYMLIGRRYAKVPLCVITVICCVFFCFGVFSHITYGRSVMSTLAEWILASNKVTDEEVTTVFNELTKAGEASFSVDPSVFDKTLKEETFDDISVIYLNADTDYDSVVFYIHGGYYVYQMGAEQMAAMNRIANETNAMVVMPIYRLAPFTTAEKGHETMMALYEKVTAENAGKKIILMGDSAGGGYSLALAEGLSARGLSQPDELVLLSPWVDVTMSNPEIADFYDPMLTVTMGKMSGEAWAGSLSLDDWLISPIYGDLSDLKNVSIFVGTRELFYPDDTLLYEKLKDNTNVTLHVGKGQNHVYPVYPTPEGRIAIEQIIVIVQR